MTYGFLDFLWLQTFAWILIVVFNGIMGGIVSIFTRSFGRKNVIAVTLKDLP